MRILVLVLAPSLAGAEMVASSLAIAWRERGHEVDVAALDPASSGSSPQVGKVLFGEQFDTCRKNKSSLPPIKQLSRLFGLRKVIGKKRYDIIYATTAIPNIYARLATLGKRHAPPVVIALQGAGSDYANRKLRIIERLLLQRTAGVLASSDLLAVEYRSSLRVPAAKLPPITVVPNGIPLVTVTRGANASKPVHVLAISRVVPQKDIETMLTGFDQFLTETGSAAFLQIVGPLGADSYGTRIRRLHSQLTHRGRIHFLGPRMDRDLLLGDAHLFLHTALAEGHPIAILEAAAAGIPILASDIPSIRESLGDGGWYFKAGNSASLSKRLKNMSTHWSEAIDRSRLLAGLVKARYSMSSCADAHLRFLEPVCKWPSQNNTGLGNHHVTAAAADQVTK